MTSRQIQWLIDDHNVQGLERALRHPSDPILRAEAAQALGDLDDLEAVEMLIRSSLEDPDPAVQKAARAALDNLVGSESKQAIATYRSGPPETDPWLKDSLAEPSFNAPIRPNYKIVQLESKNDLEGLIGCLRDQADPGMRQEAALALGEIGNLEATEALIRSYIEDPHEDVRNSAHQALDSLVGSQMDMAIAAYRSGPPAADPWLLDRSSSAGGAPEVDEDWEELSGEDLIEFLEQGEEAEEGESEEDEGLEDVPEGEPGREESLHGLITVIQTSRDPDLRQRAFQVLVHSHNIHAIWYLAQTALNSDDAELRKAANAALAERFGDQADRVLLGYKEGNLEGVELDKPDEDEDEYEDEEEDLEAEETESPYQQSPSMKDFPQTAVIQEEGVNWRRVLLTVLIVLAAAAIIYLLTAHG